DLVFARPIRWLILLYGGRVVPFVIRRNENAQGPLVQDIRSGSNTYGHRFLTTSGRAGRAIKVKMFDDYQARLLENFVILYRGERESKIRRELETHARRLGGRVSGLVAAQSSLLQEVPDLVEYPSVIAGHFPVEFLQLPEEVLTTTMIHHQHYFPVVDEENRLKPAFLAVTNMQAEKPEIIARNNERVLTARLRDARFFWDADRKATLESRIERLSTILFHKKLGSYRDKADRVSSLAEWIAREAFGKSEAAAAAGVAGRLAKADQATDMVREFTELQGTMGGIYAREEGQPEPVWKAIYFHYLPVGVEADAPPTRQQLGSAAVTWAAVSLADKLDTIAGLMIKATEQSTGSRDPYGLRRAGNGVIRLLVDLENLTGVFTKRSLRSFLEEACRLNDVDYPVGQRANVFREFMTDRLRHVMQSRDLGYEEIQVVTGDLGRIEQVNPAVLMALAHEWRRIVGTAVFKSAAEAHKRANNIVEREWVSVATPLSRSEQQALLTETAEVDLRKAVDRVSAEIETALATGSARKAIEAVGSIQPQIANFFDQVRVVVPDERLRTGRLSLLRDFRDVVARVGDPSAFAGQSG
ncbi:MAG: glycine--tRNA ligase subunit beta, partial [Acidobacteria bacterium]